MTLIPPGWYIESNKFHQSWNEKIEERLMANKQKGFNKGD
jgi:hypothetical protein